MHLTFLGKAGSQVKDCPTLYATDHDSYVVAGWQTDRPETIEIPHLLLGFAERNTFVGATLADTGRGTFLLTGRPITDTETLDQIDLESDETAIEVPKVERTFYGANTARRQTGQPIS
ncbi:hypothetical protein OH799_22265 [Nocardia sp. NBC_00881]|uniref:hypothetical protein n=1 Tax=Nocardia sp. NBC_00881 TaxID=2975995 RepID=UPI0038702A9D|nr:hypothetical protein OH799_22265 [Nocardia sp. NBC_00881]